MEASDAPVAAVDGVMAAGVGGDGGDGSGSAGRAVDMMYEYAVNMVCPKCSEAVHAALDGMVNATSVTTNVQAQLVVVEGSVAPAAIVDKLEKIGRKVKLIGSGCATAVEKGVFVVPAAVGPSGENSAGAHRSRLHLQLSSRPSSVAARARPLPGLMPRCVLHARSCGGVQGVSGQARYRGRHRAFRWARRRATRFGRGRTVGARRRDDRRASGGRGLLYRSA